MISEPTGSLNRHIVAAIDQGDALAFKCDESDRRHGLGRGGKKRGNLRPRGYGISGPARIFADFCVFFQNSSPDPPLSRKLLPLLAFLGSRLYWNMDYRLEPQSR